MIETRHRKGNVQAKYNVQRLHKQALLYMSLCIHVNAGWRDEVTCVCPILLTHYSLSLVPRPFCGLQNGLGTRLTTLPRSKMLLIHSSLRHKETKTCDYNSLCCKWEINWCGFVRSLWLLTCLLLSERRWQEQHPLLHLVYSCATLKRHPNK